VVPSQPKPHHPKTVRQRDDGRKRPRLDALTRKSSRASKPPFIPTQIIHQPRPPCTSAEDAEAVVDPAPFAHAPPKRRPLSPADTAYAYARKENRRGLPNEYEVRFGSITWLRVVLELLVTI
jgi:hypothetical protein